MEIKEIAELDDGRYRMDMEMSSEEMTVLLNIVIVEALRRLVEDEEDY